MACLREGQFGPLYPLHRSQVPRVSEKMRGGRQEHHRRGHCGAFGAAALSQADTLETSVRCSSQGACAATLRHGAAPEADREDPFVHRPYRLAVAASAQMERGQHFLERALPRHRGEDGSGTAFAEGLDSHSGGDVAATLAVETVLQASSTTRRRPVAQGHGTELTEAGEDLVGAVARSQNQRTSAALRDAGST